MLVIYRKKDSTAFFENIWKDIDNVNILDRTVITDERMKSFVNDENELIIICGEGDSKGLYKPNWNTKLSSTGDIEYMFDSHLVKFLKWKDGVEVESNKKDIPVVCLWTFSSEFMKANNLKGFGLLDFMFSKTDAEDNGYTNVTDSYMEEISNEFADNMNSIIKDYIHHKRDTTYTQYSDYKYWIRDLQQKVSRYGLGVIDHNYFSALRAIDKDGGEHSDCSFDQTVNW